MAQWGLGYGWGGFYGGGQMYNQQTLNYLTQRSLAAGNAAYAARSNGPMGNNVYAGNPNAYYNHVRDPDFFQRFDISSRRTIESQVARNVEPDLVRSTPTAGAGAGTSRTSRTSPPLLHFFSTVGKLVWPSDAPTGGDLGPKRQAIDQSTGDIYREVKDRGFASIGLVTDARTKLVDYGRPALDYLHRSSSPAVADTFHRFLLSFYDALGRSAYSGAGSAAR